MEQPGHSTHRAGSFRCLALIESMQSAMDEVSNMKIMKGALGSLEDVNDYSHGWLCQQCAHVSFGIKHAIEWPMPRFIWSDTEVWKRRKSW